MDVTLVAERFQRATEEIGKVLVGQHELVEATLIALFCEGNVLIEGVPGLGKTLLVNTLSKVLSCGFKRVQFTPDLMPSDLTGHSIYNMADQQFHFNAGPIFTNLLLADEINRAPAKTQSALLEAMQERQVTVDGTTYPLDRPFLTIATQNPLEQEGTYPLPEAQLDRFMFKLLVSYPTTPDEQNILQHYADGRDVRDLSRFDLATVLTGHQVMEVQEACTAVIVEASIINYITAIVGRTRNWHSVAVGASPRAGVNILLAARAMAACHGRNFVVPDDVKELTPWVLRHRLRLRPEAEIEGLAPDDTIREILDAVEAPAQMTPRWPFLALFAAAGVVLAFPAVASQFVDLAPATTRLVIGLGVALNFLIFAAALVDLAISPSLKKVEVEREMNDVMSVGARNAIRVWLTNRNRQEAMIEFQDEPPQPCATDGLPFIVTLAPQKARYRVYYVEPHHRGPTRFGDIFLRCTSRFGFWTFFDQRPAEIPVKVYPDIQAVHGIELLARRNRLAETGLKLSRLRGRGTEFDRLREYRREDEFRHIDWKATARQRQVISREYVVERNQNILIVLDCGRSMCNELGGISHLDRALNAAIVLSYIALRQGDNVGFLAFSNRAERWVRPVRGAGAIQTIIRHTYDIEPRYDASDYSLMIEELRRRFRKRSLVVLLTHALDELHLEAISRHVRELRSPHLVLAAFLRNVPLYDRMQSVPQTDIDAFQIAAAAEMVHIQTRQIAELNHSGLLVLDALPEQLSADLISRYLDIKARHLL